MSAQSSKQKRLEDAKHGILRYEVTAHSDDRPPIKKLADKLRNKRIKANNKQLLAA